MSKALVQVGQFWISSLAISPHSLLSTLHGLRNHHFAANSFAIIAKRQTPDRKDIIMGITWRIWTSSATLFLSLARLNKNYNCAFLFLSSDYWPLRMKIEMFKKWHFQWLWHGSMIWGEAPCLNGLGCEVLTSRLLHNKVDLAKPKHHCCDHHHHHHRHHPHPCQIWISMSFWLAGALFGHMLTSDGNIWPSEKGRFRGHPRPPRIISNGSERV